MKDHIKNIIHQKFASDSDKIIGILVLGFTTSMLASFTIWFPFAKELPFVSILSIFEHSSLWLHSTLSLVLLALLISILFQETLRNKFISLFIILLFMSLSMDILRIQPWVFYYSLMFISFVSYPKSKESQLLLSLKLILILIYVWSGVQKLNFTFFSTTFPSIIQPILSNPSPETHSLISKVSVIAPLTEIVFGLGLAFQRLRKPSVLILISMHVFILAMIGPLGKNINAGVWPWNISFILFLIVLFWNTNSFSVKKIYQKNSYYHGLIIILLGIMPFFSFFDLWPKYFSGALYSGNKIIAELYFSDQFKHTFSPNIQKIIDNEENKTTINNWALSEANIAAYPSEYYSLGIFEELCNAAESELDIIMILKNEPNIISGKREDFTYFCTDIKG